MTLVELLTPWRGGWNNIADDIREGWSQTVSPGGLGPGAAFGPRLLLGAPLSFVRYPLAWACKNPISSVAFAAAAFALTATYGDLDAAEASSAQPEMLVDLWSYFAFQGLEWLVFSRVLLVGLLEERNYVLGELPYLALMPDALGAREALRAAGAANCSLSCAALDSLSPQLATSARRA